jgi:hypothetical protein
MGTLEDFWSMIAGEANQQRNSIRNPIIQVYHSWMCKRILGRMRETNITNTELNWLYSALIARQSTIPTSGCYLSMLAISLRLGITRNPKHLLPRTSLGFEYMKQGKYISGDEKGGFKLAKVNLPLPGGRLRLFVEGKED